MNRIHTLAVIALTPLLLLSTGCAQVNGQAPREKEAAAQEPVPRARPDTAAPPASALPADVSVEFDPITNAVLILRGNDLSRGLKIQRELEPLRANGRYGPLALRLIGYYNELFGLQTPTRELQEQALHADADGGKRVQFSQQFAGIPVWNGRLEARFNRRDQLTEIGGHYLPTALLARIDRQPFIAEQAAEQVAATELDALACSGCQARLVFYPQGANPRLAYQIGINDERGDRWQVLVDAGSGEVLHKVRL